MITKKWLMWIGRSEKVTGNGRQVAAHIYDAGVGGTLESSAGVMGKEIGIPTVAVNRGVKELVNEGWLDKVQTKPRSTVYQFTPKVG